MLLLVYDPFIGGNGLIVVKYCEMLVGSGWKRRDATYVGEVKCGVDVYCPCTDYGRIQCACYPCGAAVGDAVETGERGESSDEKGT